MDDTQASSTAIEDSDEEEEQIDFIDLVNNCFHFTVYISLKLQDCISHNLYFVGFFRMLMILRAVVSWKTWSLKL